MALPSHLNIVFTARSADDIDGIQQEVEGILKNLEGQAQSIRHSLTKIVQTWPPSNDRGFVLNAYFSPVDENATGEIEQGIQTKIIALLQQRAESVGRVHLTEDYLGTSLPPEDGLAASNNLITYGPGNDDSPPGFPTWG